jgi:hypothetical protein
MYINTVTNAVPKMEDPRLSSLGIDIEPYRKSWRREQSALIDVPIELLREKGVDVRWLDIV